MATMTALRGAARGETGAGPSRDRGRALTVLVVLLAGAGLALAGLQVRGALVSSDSPALGEAADTGFGTLTVTRTHTTFVPATQGPPTMAQMTGSTGSGQLQVWVRLTNTEAPAAVAYSEDQFRLVDAAGHRSRPDGSSLASARLPRGAVVDAQVWFDLAGTDGQADAAKRWLEFRTGDGQTIRIALPAGSAGVEEQHGNEGGGTHEH